MFTILDNTHQNVIAFRASGKIEKEDYDEFVLDFAVPGMKKEDFSIHLEDDQLTVSSGRKEEEKKDEDNTPEGSFPTNLLNGLSRYLNPWLTVIKLKPGMIQASCTTTTQEGNR